MKKLILTISIMIVFVTNAMAAEMFIFGPNWAGKEKGKAQEIVFPFEFNSVTNAKYVLSVKKLKPRSSVKVILNGNELITRKTLFAEGKIEIEVSLLSKWNEIGLMVYKGEVAVAIKEITPLAVIRTLHCAVMGTNGMLVGAGFNVNVQILPSMKLLKGVTRMDGFCEFTELPLEGTAVIHIFGDGFTGSEVVSLKTTEDFITSMVYLYQQDIGKISGYTDPNAIVQAIFQAPPDYSVPNVMYKNSTISDMYGAFVFDGMPLEQIRLQVNVPRKLKTGSKYIRLSDGCPEIEVDIETESPGIIMPKLLNGDFSSGTAYWGKEGVAGVSQQAIYFSDTEGNPCDPDEVAEEYLYCGAIAAVKDYEISSLSQTFIVPDTALTLECRARYITEAYRYGPSDISDDFSIRVEKEDGSYILAEGCENTYSFDESVDISMGLIGMSSELNLKFDLESMRGEAVKILAEIRSSKTIFTSVLAIAEVNIAKEKYLFFHSDHSFSLPTTLNIEAGMVVKLQFVNTNPILGTSLLVKNIANKQTQILAVPPGKSRSMVFDIFGCEPIGWKFELRGQSIINNFIFCKVYSTWVQGMPINN